MGTTPESNYKAEIEKRQLLGDGLEEWRCPKCGAMAYTLKEQQAMLVKCSGEHGNTLVWMKRVEAQP